MGYADPAELGALNAVIDERGRGQRPRAAGGTPDVQRLRPLRRRTPASCRARSATGPSSSPGWRSTRASARSSSAPTTPTTYAASPLEVAPGGARAGRGRANEPCAVRAAAARSLSRAQAVAAGRRRSPSTPTPDDGAPITGALPWDESDPADVPGAGRRARYTRGRAGVAAAPRRHPRRPARRADAAARRGRPGRGAG